MRRLVSLISVAVLSLAIALTGGRLPVAAQAATPAASPGGGVSPETLVEAIIPAASIPPAESRFFFLGHVTIEPAGQSVSPAEVYACCPGPQFEHVLAGELSLRVEGPLRVMRAGRDEAPGPLEEVTPGTEVVLRPGDTAIYQTQLTTEYHNRGADPVHFIQSALFPELPPTAPADASVGITTDTMAIADAVPSPPPGSLVATLQRATLPPDGIFPAPPPGVLQLVIPAPGSPAVAETSDGAFRNIGQESAVLYALSLRAGDGEDATPVT